MKTTCTLLLSLLIITGIAAQSVPDSCRLRIGTNLSGPADWGSEFPFVNIMKYSREWISHNNQWVGGGTNAWDTGVLNQIPMDENGYPLALPVDIPGQEAPQIVRTVWANTEALPEGRYVVLYDGTGDLDVWGDATLVNEEPGRLEFDLAFQDDIFALEIYVSQAGDHIRNIRVLLPGTEATYEANPWEANWLEKLGPFQAIRFMDWGYTNHSAMRQWYQRTQLNDYTWTQKNGVPYEMWAALCNLKKADAWVCVPHAASDDFVVQMATFFRDNLDPDLKLYVEYSNEVWNWIFAQAHYGLDSLDQNLAWPERLAPRIAHVMQLWTEVFAGQTDRLVRVQGGHHAWFDIGRRIFLQLEADNQEHLIDAISPAAYMGLDHEHMEANWNASTTGQEVLDHAADFTFNQNEYAMQGWYDHAGLAAAKGKKLLFYEGGQHFTPNPFGTVQPYCDALVECQTLPGMYDLYEQLFDTLRTLSNEEMLLMNFSFISPKNCQYGTWGLLQSQFSEQPPFSNAPKYQAVKDAIVQYNSCQDITATGETLDAGPVIYPNPAREAIWVKWEGKDIAKLEISVFDITGKPVATSRAQGFIKLENCGPGVYIVYLTDGQHRHRQLIVK